MRIDFCDVCNRYMKAFSNCAGGSTTKMVPLPDFVLKPEAIIVACSLAFVKRYHDSFYPKKMYL